MAIATAQRPKNWHAPGAAAAGKIKPSRLLEYFVILEILCQLALLSSTLQYFRIVFRTTAFGLSLALLFILFGRGSGRLHPAAKPAFFVLLILGLSILNPGINSYLSAAAQFGIYLAILAPLFWVPRLRIDFGEMRRVLFIMWAFQAISSLFGVLQVYFPARFQFNISSVVKSNGAGYLSMEQFRNIFGQMVYRPMGLTDTPGGAAAAGFIAVLFAAAFFLLERRRWMRGVYAGAMLVGMAAIYLSEVRVMLVLEVVCVLAFISLMTLRASRVPAARNKRQGGAKRLVWLTSLMMLVGIVGFSWAVAMGGTAIEARINTLTSQNPNVVYQKNRGQFLWYTIDDVLPEYPLGAGPGRWGMMYYYFGNPQNTRNPALWSEIQWTGWLYDGGVPLVVMYAMALALALRVAYKIALNGRFVDLGTLAALIFAYDVGTLAATFDSNFFISGGGMDFWLLNAMLFNAAYHTFRSAPQANRQTAER